MSKTRWHTSMVRTLHAMMRSAGMEVTYEPRSLAPPGQPQVRVDLANHSMVDGADVHCDVRTYCASAEATLATEAQFPGTVADWVEREKTAKHLPVIKAHNPRDRFFAFAVSEHGSLGPQAHELLDMVFIRSACPGAAKTYWMRRLAVVTANAVHDMLHRQLRRLPDPSGAAALPLDSDLHGQIPAGEAGGGAPRGVGQPPAPPMATGAEAGGSPVGPVAGGCGCGSTCDGGARCARRAACG